VIFFLPFETKLDWLLKITTNLVEIKEVWNQFEFEALNLSENVAFCLKLCGGSKGKLTRNCS
jgi:hypothetical protein